LEPLEIHFLGTGGGRFVTFNQMRRTAGYRMVHGETHVHVDPGPGAVVFSNWARLSPRKLDAVVVTHCHPDHYTDAEVLVEAMTQGTRTRSGLIAASGSALCSEGSTNSGISGYHQALAKQVVELKPGVSFQVGVLNFTAVEARHSDPETVGLTVDVPEVGRIGYTSDTSFFPELPQIHRGLRLLIVCVLRPRGRPLQHHFCTEDAIELLRDARPRCCVITHFGIPMLRVGPESEAEHIEGETGVPTVAARDGMTVSLGERVEVRGPRKCDEPRHIDT